jgi:hypothetical protein
MNQLHQDQSEIRGLRAQIWLATATALIAGLLGIHFLAERGLQRNMEAQAADLRLELTNVRNELKLLVDAREDAAAANSLLAELRQQREQVDDARKSLAAAGRLLAESRSALNGIVALKAHIKAEAASIEEAECRLGQLGSLKSRVLSESDGVERAEGNANDLIALKSTINKGAADIAAARANADAMIALQNALASRGSWNAKAQANLKALVQLCDAIAGSDDTLLKARANADQMRALLKDLSSDLIDVPAAGRNLKKLIEIQIRLNERSRNIADAVQTLELLSDLQDEIASHVRSLGGVRKELLELALMENTVSRVARMLRPLTQLVNLRRLGDRDIREAARGILENRNRRLSRNELPAATRSTVGRVANPSYAAEAAKPATKPVPFPADLD